MARHNVGWWKGDRVPLPQLEIATLERVKLYFEDRVGRYAMESMKAEVLVDQLSCDLIVRMAMSVLAAPVGEGVGAASLTTSVTVYDTWQDHFKATWPKSTWLGWFFRLVTNDKINTHEEKRSETVSLKYRELVGYPKLDLPFNENQTCQQIAIYHRA